MFHVHLHASTPIRLYFFALAFVRQRVHSPQIGATSLRALGADFVFTKLPAPGVRRLALSHRLLAFGRRGIPGCSLKQIFEN